MQTPTVRVKTNDTSRLLRHRRRSGGTANLLVKLRHAGRFPGELLIIEIHRKEAELFGVAELPFEVVQQRPVKKSAHVHAMVHGGAQFAQVARQILDAKILVARSRAVLGDINRQIAIAVQFF